MLKLCLLVYIDLKNAWLQPSPSALVHKKTKQKNTHPVTIDEEIEDTNLGNTCKEGKIL